MKLGVGKSGVEMSFNLLIVILVLEMSIVGVFMKKEPWWYIISYPYFFHPGRGIVQVTKKPFIPYGPSIMAILVVEFSREEYKTRQLTSQSQIYP